MAWFILIAVARFAFYNPYLKRRLLRLISHNIIGVLSSLFSSLIVIKMHKRRAFFYHYLFPFSFKYINNWQQLLYLLRCIFWTWTASLSAWLIIVYCNVRSISIPSRYSLLFWLLNKTSAFKAFCRKSDITQVGFYD